VSDPYGPQWTVPPPPPGQPTARLKAGRVWGGIGIAMAGHVATILIAIGLVAVDPRTGFGLVLGLVLQVLLFIACLTVGIVLIVRQERGIGLGLLIGWAVGVIVFPVIGFGICLYYFSQLG
jgi:hypothetical protein